MALRRLVWAKGLRYRVDAKPLVGLRRRADLTFSRARVAVYVDGCFWHGCPKHGTVPKENHAWWSSKLANNVKRDRDTDRRLRAAGWTVVRIWEHEDPARAARRVTSAVRAGLDRTLVAPSSSRKVSPIGRRARGER